jgi:choline dehydrogenase-like flavoprotein
MDVDVAIVGAGPCGAAAAWRLATSGLSVTVIERGAPFDPDALRRDDPDWEMRRAGALSSNPNIRGAADDDPVDDADSPIKPMFAHGEGGTSTHWSAHVPRFRPADFRAASVDGAGRDWPIGTDDLAPWYELAERRWGVAFLPGDPSCPPRQGAPLRLPTLGAHGRRLAAAFDALGWHWWPVDLVVGRDADAPGAARCTHVGPCDLGCPSRLRSTAARAFLDDARAAGARLLPRTRVLAIETDAQDRASALVCRGEAGRFRLRAHHVMLAANGAATPHLLLLSADGRHPQGLANGSGLVGRGLMLHPYARVDGRFAEPLGSWVSGEKAGLVSFQFAHTDPARGFRRGVKLQLVTAPGPAALARGAVTGRPLPWGAAHHAAFEAVFDRLLGLTVCAEDLPEDHNRISLSDRLTDRDGLPAQKWSYALSPASRAALDFGLARGGEVLRAAGAEELFHTRLRDQAGFHIMGTARMGTDPDAAVTDPFGTCHQHRNLHIVDASVFVSGTVFNPTLTAQALALRAADRLVARRREH